MAKVLETQLLGHIVVRKAKADPATLFYNSFRHAGIL
jgi:hypothetical protein